MQYVSKASSALLCPGPDNLETLPMPSLEMPMLVESEPHTGPGTETDPEIAAILRQKTLMLGEVPEDEPEQSQECLCDQAKGEDGHAEPQSINANVSKAYDTFLHLNHLKPTNTPRW